MALNYKKKLLSTVDALTQEKQFEALLKVAEAFLENDDDENEPDVEDDEVPAPRKAKGKLRKVADDDDDNDDDDNSDDEDEKPVKKNTKKSAKIEKAAPKKSAKTEKPKAAPKATDTDYSEMSKAELKGAAEAYGLEAKAIKGEDVAELLESIDKAASKGPDVWEKKAAKAKVEVKQPRGRSSDEKKARVIIVHMINAGQSPF